MVKHYSINNGCYKVCYQFRNRYDVVYNLYDSAKALVVIHYGVAKATLQDKLDLAFWDHVKDRVKSMTCTRLEACRKLRIYMHDNCSYSYDF